ncbi:MAG TPA: porin [Kofleriaceae bacterium]|nr:porin [Kofleriaceae bacterium]
MVAALSIPGGVLAQPAPAPAPEPAPAGQPAPSDQPATPENPANPPAPGPPPAAAQPPTVAPPAPASTPSAYPTMVGPALKLSDLFTWRPGVFVQLWGSFVQDVNKQSNGDSGDFARNIYLRRARFFMGGTIGSSLTYFMLWESANNGAPIADAMGNINKQNTTFAFNDAYLDFKINPNVSVQAGLMLLPFTRNILQSTSTYWTLDIGGVSASYIAATQTNVLRDYGAQLKINAVENHLELRGMVSEGVRIPDLTPSSAPPTPAARNAGKNNPRLTGFVQYNFLDPDTGYVFNGQYFGRKKIAGIAAGIDYQPISSDNPYFATSATAFAAIPIKGADPKNGGDEVGGQFEYLHFHGGGVVPGSPASGLGKQDAVLVEAGYYNKAAKLSFFGKFEGRFLPEAAKAGNQRIYGVGLKYFLAEQIANLTLMYSLTQAPDISDMAKITRNDSNAIQLQLQVGYF